MSHNVVKFYHASFTDAPARQTITTSYDELTGSRCAVSLKSSGQLIVKYCFYIASISTSNRFLLHVKIQTSNDDFNSDINDVSGQKFNVSGDTLRSDTHFQCCSTFFVIENFVDSHVRVVARAYSNNNEAYLHRSYNWDGAANEVYFNPSLLVMEI